MTGAPFHSSSGILAGETVGGTPIPILPDGIVTFDGAEAESIATGRAWDFELQLQGDAIPIAI